MKLSSEPSTFRSWLAVASLGLGSFASVSTEFLPIGLLPDIATSFDVSTGTAGLTMTLPALFAAFSAPVVMLLAGRLDRRRILLLLSSLLLAACLIAAMAPTFGIMLISRAMVGISLGAFWAMALAVAGRLVAQHQTHKATAAVFAGVTAAMIFGVPLGTFVAEQVSWRAAFLATGLIAAVALAIQSWALPSLPSATNTRLHMFVDTLKHAPSRKSMSMVILLFSAHAGTYTYVSPFMQQVGLDAQSITTLLLGFGLVGFASNFLASSLLAKNLKAVLVGVLVLLFFTLVALPLASEIPLLVIALIMIWGIAWGALPLSLNTWHQNTAEGGMEIASATFTLTTQTAIALGSFGGGVIVDHFGIDADFVAGGLLSLACAMLLIVYKPQASASTCSQHVYKDGA